MHEQLRSRSARITTAVVAVAVGVVVTSSAAASSRVLAGKLVFVTGGDETDRLEIATAAPSGGSIRKLTHQAVGGFAPTWTTTGRKLVFWTVDSFTGGTRRWRMSPDGRRLEQLPNGVPSPSGSKFARLTSSGLDVVSARGRLLRRVRLRLKRVDYYNNDPLWSGDDAYVAVGVSTETERADYSRTFVIRVVGRRSVRVLSRRKERIYESALAWSRDGRRLLIDQSPSDRSGGHRAFIVDRETGRRRRLRATFDSLMPFDVTGDLSSVAYATKKGEIVAVTLATGARTRLARTRGGRTWEPAVAWSPRGDQVAYSDNDGIHVVRAHGSSRRHRRIVRIAGADYPAWSPNGRRLAFSVGGGRIYVVRADGRGLRRLTHSIWDDSPELSPDGSRIAFMRGPNGLKDPAAFSVLVMNAAGSAARRIGRGYGPRWSQDGSLVAFVDPVPSPDPPEMTTLRNGDLTVASPDRSLRRVVSQGTAPAWSPDGRIAFMRYVFGRVEDATGRRKVWAPIRSTLFVVNPDGTGLRELVTTDVPILTDPSWSPDGRTIVLSARTDDAADYPGAAFVDVEAPSSWRFVKDLPFAQYAWSPDGQRLAFADSDGAQTARLDGSDRRVLWEAGLAGHARGRPAWSPDGSSIAFIGCIDDRFSDSDICDVYVAAADGSARTRVTRTRGVEGAVDWAP